MNVDWMGCEEPHPHPLLIQLVIKEGVVYEPQALLKAAEGKIGPSGPDDHDFWELKIKPLVRR